MIAGGRSRLPLSLLAALAGSVASAQVQPPVCTGASRVFPATGQVQSFVVPAGVTSVTIDAAGGAGGAASDFGSQTAPGGLGARMVASFAVTPGETLSIVAGAAGTGSFVDAGGGGGASYVYRTPTAPGLLLAAAGGGGAFESVAGGDGQVGAAQAGGGFGSPGAAGSGGNGGGGGQIFCNAGGGGGGLLTDGGDGYGGANCGGSVPVGGGKALANGSAGGVAVSGSNGGFGGGGGGGSNAGGGGGGGYNGGGGGSLGQGGGGGSYVDPAATQLYAQSGVNGGDGSVSICYVAPALPAASPLSLAVLAVALALSAAWVLRRTSLG